MSEFSERELLLIGVALEAAVVKWRETVQMSASVNSDDEPSYTILREHIALLAKVRFMHGKLKGVSA